MSADSSTLTSPERRLADALPVRFDGAALKASHATTMADADVETIDMDALLPPGEHDHTHHAPATQVEMTPEQKRGRLQIVKFKQTLDEFALSSVSQVTIANIKRGDVIQIKTIVGSIYIRVIDRIRGNTADIGEILGEFLYDLQDQWGLTHMASLVLPVCTKSHVIVNPDGTRRNASRALKMTTEAVLPEQVGNLLRESFFSEIHIHATPVPDKLRVIDVGRWLLRMLRKVKGWVDENNRREREKKELEAARKLQKQQEKLAKKQKAAE
jgi:hypothetical protein